MNQWLISVVVFVLVMAGMAIGVIYGRKPLKGTCGGLNNVGMQGTCEICGNDPAKCDNPDQASFGVVEGRSSTTAK